jgi:pimeloyl-ACP methyl ester carboxylesterase
VPDDAPLEEYLELAGGRVHVFRGGHGEPVLFLHAAGGAGEWNEFHGLLAAAGFGVVAPDHPGFGKSDDFPDVEAIDDLVYHYLDVMDALGLRRAHVVGGSFGGWIAAELAVAAPERIGSLVLLSAAGLRLPDHPVPDIFIMTPGQLVATLFHDPPPPPPPPPSAPAPEGAAPDFDAILAAYRDASALARFCWSPYMCDPKLERRLHRVTAPTLVVAPSDDRLIPVAHARRYASLIPGARFTEVPDCGHAMYFERPSEFAEITAAFLAEHSLADNALTTNGLSNGRSNSRSNGLSNGVSQ